MRFALTQLDISISSFGTSSMKISMHDDDSKITTELKDVILRELGRLTSQIVDKAITDPGPLRLLAVTPRKRAQSGSFIIIIKRC